MLSRYLSPFGTSSTRPSHWYYNPYFSNCYDLISILEAKNRFYWYLATSFQGDITYWFLLDETKQLEAIQRRAMKLIYGGNLMTFHERWIQWSLRSTNGTSVHEPAEPDHQFALSDPGQAQQWHHLQTSWPRTKSRTLDSNWTLQNVNNHNGLHIGRLHSKGKCFFHLSAWKSQYMFWNQTWQAWLSRQDIQSLTKFGADRQNSASITWWWNITGLWLSFHTFFIFSVSLASPQVAILVRFARLLAQKTYFDWNTCLFGFWTLESRALKPISCKKSL